MTPGLLVRPSDLARRLEQVHKEMCCIQDDILGIRNSIPFTRSTCGTYASLEKDWRELQYCLDCMSVIEDRMRELDRDLEAGRLR